MSTNSTATPSVYSTSQHKRAQLIRNLDRLLSIRYNQLQRARRQRIQSGQFPHFYKPRMDIWDNPDSPTITALVELPGLKKEEISLLIQDGSLVVWGERRCRVGPGSVSPGKYPVQEIKYGEFRRVIPLPQGAQSNEISASIMDGMLTVAWPRYPALYPGEPAGTG